MYSPPNVEAHFISQDLLGTSCLLRVSYTTEYGREIVIEKDQLVGVFRRKPDPEIGRILGSCGYDNQTIRSKATNNLKVAIPSIAPVSFAEAVQSDSIVPYNRKTCEAIGAPVRVSSSFTLAFQKLNAYRIKVAEATGSLPYLPAFETRDGMFGRFDESDSKCKMQFLINGQPYICNIDRLVTNRWLPKNIEKSKNQQKMPDEGDLWNGGIYPDLNSPPQCSAQQDQANDSARRKTESKGKPSTIDQVQLVEASGIEHELAALGAGNGPACDTSGYLAITSRIEKDLGLRAIERNVCGSGNSLRKSTLKVGQEASKRKIDGCFTATGMSAYLRRANDWLNAVSEDCKGKVGNQARAFIQDATAWAIDQL
jgi:hypothetical protein